MIEWAHQQLEVEREKTTTPHWNMGDITVKIYKINLIYLKEGKEFPFSNKENNENIEER